MHIIVIGAGCTGLLIAQGLRKHGISCTVFERSSKDRPFRDWSMMLHWARDVIREAIPEDVADRFFAECDTDRPVVQRTSEKDFIHPCFNGKTGKVLVELPIPPVRRYSRAKAVKILSQGVDVQYDKKVIDIVVGDAGVEAVFADGSREAGDLLVGADSANSFVRSWLFDHASFAKSSDLPMIVYNFPVSLPADLALRVRDLPDGTQRLIVHPDHTSWWVIMNLDVDEAKPPEEWKFQYFFTHWTDTEAPTTPAERLKHFKQLGTTYAEPFRSAALAVDDSTQIQHDRLKYWAEPRIWNNRKGRVTLAGDSAHPFPPHRGQGLNNSFADAVKFVKTVASIGAPGEGILNGHIDSAQMEQGLNSYSQEIFERGKQEIEVSVKQAHAATHFDEYLESATVKFGVKPVPR